MMVGGSAGMIKNKAIWLIVAPFLIFNCFVLAGSRNLSINPSFEILENGTPIG